ncbi:hypothetical protein [Candidatus Uabimicrobium amorphum]|uniref:Uncharacterized protein n=1 Tax=Uabimicrobium amorphum TaxID=2596890 RepID=A0A5S9F215_UABAM|nr:hypothetical protein [Candidatus Uabimicrobium amorphum]BBM82771.1 hypothetical protein UABAM_01114 [Candidatus Uabimicrobium amorphum]
MAQNKELQAEMKKLVAQLEQQFIESNKLQQTILDTLGNLKNGKMEFPTS